MDSSSLLSKFTIFLMDKDFKPETMSQKDWLKIQFQEAGNQDLDDKMIDKLADFKFEYPNHSHDL